MKKIYHKPELTIIMLQNRSQLLYVSPPTNVNSNLSNPEDELIIEDTPQSGWGR